MIVNDKIRKMKQNIMDFAKNHCEFHYQSSYEFLNLGSGLIKLDRISEALPILDKSIKIYKENADSYYVRGFVKYLNNDEKNAVLDFREAIKYKNTHPENYKSDDIEYMLYSKIKSYKKFNFIHHTNRNVRYDNLKQDDLQVLYNKAEILFNEQNFTDFVTTYQSITQITMRLHFEYHVNLANLYFALAQELQKSDLFYEAIFFADKALETDSENPHNIAYDNLILKCREHIQNQSKNYGTD